MFCYDNIGMKGVLWGIIVKNSTAEVQDWLQKMGDTQNGTANFNTAFILTPRKTGKVAIQLDSEERDQLATLRPGF